MTSVVAHRFGPAVAALVAFCCAGLVPAPTRADYKTLYVAGLRAKAEARWNDALTFFTESALEAEELSENPRGELIRPYGTWTESYQPGYYRGLSLYRLGHYAEALEAWSEALAGLEAVASGGVSDHPVTYPRNRSVAAQLEALVESIPERLEARYRLLVAKLAGADARLQVVRRYLGQRGEETVEVAAGVASSASLPERLEALRSLLQGRLADPGRRGPEPLDRAVTLRDDESRVRMLLDDLESLEALRRGLLSVERIQLEEDLRDQRHRLFAEARAELELGACETAISKLHRLVRGEAYGRLSPSDGVNAYRLLAEADLGCRSDGAASLYLRLARRFDPDAPPDELADRVAALPAPSGSAAVGQLAPESATAVAAARYLEALGWLALGRCREEPFELIRSASDVLLVSPDLGAGALAAFDLDFTPFLARARAHHLCSSRAERDLDLARARGMHPDLAVALEQLGNELGTPRTAEQFEGSYALIISVWDYENPESWKPLSGAREDIEPVRRTLTGLGFNVLEPVENPTKSELMKALRDFAKSFGTNESNRLVVYYAGHGHTWTDPKQSGSEAPHTNGFLVPSDAPRRVGRDYLWDLLSMEELQTQTGLRARRSLTTDARHVMFAFDTCFGAALFDELEGVVVASLAEDDPRRLLARPARFFITAGGADQTVPNYSIFRRFLIAALEGDADSNGDGIVLGQEIGDFVRPMVEALSDPDRPNTPQWAWMVQGDLAADAVLSVAPGDLGFERPSRRPWPGLRLPDPSSALESELAFWPEVRCPERPAECAAFLEIFDGGWLSAFAKAQLPPTNFQ